MAIEYIIETILVVGFMLSVLVVCKWVEDFRFALDKAKESGSSVWAELRRAAEAKALIEQGLADQELVEQEQVDGPVVYLKVSNPSVPVKVSVRSQAHQLAMKKAANSE